MAREEIKIKRTYTETDEQGNEISAPVEIEGVFSVEWPEARDESYERFFENEDAIWQNELRGLQTKVKQAAGSYILTNASADGLQEYMDDYTISTRSSGGGRKKEIKVTQDALTEAGVSMEQMENLAALLGMKVISAE